MYAWDISHTLVTTYHPYAQSPSALTEYLKNRLRSQRAKRLGCSLPAQVEQSVQLEHNSLQGAVQKAPATIHTIWFWTFCVCSISPLDLPGTYQSWQPYPSTGRQTAFNTNRQFTIDSPLMVLPNNLSVTADALALLHIMVTCVFHLSLLCMKKPRYLAQSEGKTSYVESDGKGSLNRVGAGIACATPGFWK